jgi:hypothetical protein
MWCEMHKREREIKKDKARIWKKGSRVVSRDK